MKHRKKRWITGEDAEVSAELTAEERVPRLTDKLYGMANAVRERAIRHKAVLLQTVLPVVYALLFGCKGFEMGIFPFGIAAVCASPSGVSAFLTAAGAAVSSLFVRGGFYIMAVCFAGAAALAVTAKIKRGSDGAAIRAGLSVVMGAVQVIAYTASDGINFYDICAILLAAAICPVLAVSLRGLFLSDGRLGIGVEWGVYVILYTAVYSIRSFSYTGASAATVISMLATLYSTYAFGMYKGIAVGVAVGLASDPVYSAIYAASAVTSGVLINLSPIGAVTVGAVTALAFGIHSAGAAAFGDLFPEFAFSAALAGPLFRYGILPAYHGTSESGALSRDVGEIRLDRMRDRLHALSDSLGSVAAVMRRASKVFVRPSYGEMRQLCDDAFDESCQSCSHMGLCWDKEYRATATAVGKMAAELHSGKSVGQASLPEGMRSRCPQSDAIISRIKLGAASASIAAVTSDRTAATADDFRALSRLIDEAVADAEAQTEPDSEGSLALSERLREMGLSSAETEVYGERRRMVWIRGLEHGCSLTGEEFRSAAQSVLDCPMTLPEYRINGREVSLEMHTAEVFEALFGRSCIPKRGEKCGDSITAFKVSGGRFYTVLSDGMGSGGEAALTSGAAAVFLERMLYSGCDLTTAADMLNTFLERRNSECFATVDILEADLVTGELRFLKSGAAPSFVLREGRVFRLASKTMPAGIVTPFDGEILSFTARVGDFVIMLSDGVIPDGDDGSWLCDMLTAPGTFLTPATDLAQAAEGIAKEAARRSGHGDDVTVGIVRLDGC